MTYERLVARKVELERELDKARAMVASAQRDMATGQQQVLLITGAITLAKELLDTFSPPPDTQ